jgi:RNA polymerase sigma-70 factor (ECF subfamily)
VTESPAGPEASSRPVGPEASSRPVGPYLVQAAIAQCHATARTAAATNWALIADLYGLLTELIPSDVVRLNWAVAVGMAHGPAAGLERVEALAAGGGLDGYYLLPATRADLLRRLGRAAEAAQSYRQALDLAVNEAERRYLAGRLAEMAAAGNGSTPG